MRNPAPIAEDDGRVEIQAGCPEDGPARCSGNLAARLAGQSIGSRDYEVESGRTGSFFALLGVCFVCTID